MKKTALVLIALLVALGCILCAGCTMTPAEKKLEELVSDFGFGEATQTSTSTGSFDINGYKVSYKATIADGARTLDLTVDNKKYTLKGPTQDAICGSWTGDKELSVTFEEDGCGTYEYPDSVYTHTFFWGKEDDGSYKFVFADNTMRTAKLSLDGLKDSEGLSLKKQA